MNFIIVRPFDDKDIVEVLAVQHAGKKRNTFQTQWDEALARVKNANPTEWGINDVYENLENQGWTIMKLDTITVEY